jgi:recombination protein RecA
MNKEIDKLFATINKNFGANTIRVLTQEDASTFIKTCSSGSLTLDLALGKNGFPRGRIIEVYGPQAGGKTTICLFALAEFQRLNEGYVAFIDAEHAFNPELAIAYGVDITKMALVQPMNAENAIDTAEALIRSGQFRAIVVDSVSALTPTKIVESSMEQQTMGMLGKFMSTACSKLDSICAYFDCSVFFINQIREKIGVMHGNPETTSGGRALPFYSSIRLNVRAGEKIQVKDDVVGHWVKVKVTKNKISMPFKEAIFPLYYGKGIDRVYEIVELACIAEIVTQGGAWFKYLDDKGEILQRDGDKYMWQGKANLTEFAKTTPQFLAELEDKLRGKDIQAPQGTPEDQEGYGEEAEPVAAI